MSKRRLLIIIPISLILTVSAYFLLAGYIVTGTGYQRSSSSVELRQASEPVLDALIHIYRKKSQRGEPTLVIDVPEELAKILEFRVLSLLSCEYHQYPLSPENLSEPATVPVIAFNGWQLEDMSMNSGFQQYKLTACWQQTKLSQLKHQLNQELRRKRDSRFVTDIRVQTLVEVRFFDGAQESFHVYAMEAGEWHPLDSDLGDHLCHEIPRADWVDFTTLGSRRLGEALEKTWLLEKSERFSSSR